MNHTLRRAFRKLDTRHAWEVAGGALALVLLVIVGMGFAPL